MSRVLIDACVLYPTVLRGIVLGVAKRGYFTPLWSDRILEEWRRAAARHEEPTIAETEIVLAKLAFPSAIVTVSETTRSGLSLPDPDDNHVLAAAIDGQAGELLTLNLKDFPTRTLSAHGIIRRDPDGFLLEALDANKEDVDAAVQNVLIAAASHGIDVNNPRALLKRARLPRLAKALFQD